jgi:hypothetical protein
MFKEWNNDPIGNNDRLVAGVDPKLGAVVKRAQELANADGFTFVVGSGTRTPEQQQKAYGWGWSKTPDVAEHSGMAVDAWATVNGQVTFDPKEQARINGYMERAAKEQGVQLDEGAKWKTPDAPHFALARGQGTAGWKPGASAPSASETDVQQTDAGLNLTAARKAIRSNESNHLRDPYRAIGPEIQSGDFAGDHAYGAYQVMGNNIPGWTKAALGQSLTIQQFLSDPAAQDKTFDYMFTQYYRKYGNVRDAASTWFTGGPYTEKSANKSDRHWTNRTYVTNFMSAYQNGGGDPNATTTPTGAPSALGGVVRETRGGGNTDFTYAPPAPAASALGDVTKENRRPGAADITFAPPSTEGNVPPYTRGPEGGSTSHGNGMNELWPLPEDQAIPEAPKDAAPPPQDNLSFDPASEKTQPTDQSQRAPANATAGGGAPYAARGQGETAPVLAPHEKAQLAEIGHQGVHEALKEGYAQAGHGASAIPDGSNAQAMAEMAQGKGGMDWAHYEYLARKVDPTGTMPIAQRNLLLHGYVKQMADAVDLPSAGVRANLALVQTERQISNAYAERAKDLLAKGDEAGAIQMATQSFNWVSNGSTVDIQPDQNGQYQVTVTNEKGQVSVSQSMSGTELSGIIACKRRRQNPSVKRPDIPVAPEQKSGSG